MGSISNQASNQTFSQPIRDRALRLDLLRPATSERSGREAALLGDDESGIALEVMAVELEDGDLYVIHAMPLRDRYRAENEEAKRWRG